MERLQKVLAQSNIASRRKSEEIILAGRVKVNGAVVTELGFKVDKDDVIEVDGKPISRAQHVYFLLNKPTGYVSTTSDEKGRQTVLDLPNDGEFTNKMTHPEHEIEKEYLARVEGVVIRKKIVELRKGVRIDDDYLAIPKAVRLIEIDKVNQTTLISMVLIEGRNKQVRKMVEAIGHTVKKLTRVRYDFLTLEGVERGAYRSLKIHEVRKLYANATSKKS